MDEHPGSQRIPLTLNKYLYGNADPVNFVDPSGYMSMAGSMSAIGGFAVVAMVALPTYNNLIVPNHSGLLVRPPIWHTMALMYFKALTVNVIDVMSISNKNYKDTGTHKHHTIPISMCGADDQEKSLIRSDDHSAIHAQIATIQVALEAAERLATKQTVGHRRHSVILQLAQTEDGRRTIVNALSQVYKSGGWWDIGSDPIGVVFNTEKGPYISGAKTSLGNKRGVCVRNK